MEGVTGGLGIIQRGRARRPGGQIPPEAEAKCEITVQFLTFHCTKFSIE